MQSFLLFGGLLFAAWSSLTFAFPLTELPSSDVILPRSFDQASSHYVPLGRSVFLDQSQHKNPFRPGKTTPPYSTYDSQAYYVELKAGTQSFRMLLDTGSSDLWFPAPGFQCIDIETSATDPENYCGFGSVYNASASQTFKKVTNENMMVSYGSSGAIIGIVGTEEITLGGITVPDQIIGVINRAAWEGDYVTSGILGMAYPAAGNFYRGTDPSADVQNHEIQYNPLFTSMWKRGATKPLFSLALNRGPPGDSEAGYLAFNGLPPVETTEPCVQTPIIISPFDIYTSTEPNPVHEHALYSINFDGFTYQANNVTSHHDPMIRNTTSFPTYLDCGSSALFIDPTAVDHLNSLFSPPAIYNETIGATTVSCDSIPPNFAFTIAGKDFKIDPRDLVQSNTDGTCSTAFVRGAGPATIGIPFFENVVVVHDVGESQIRVYARQEY